MAFDKKELGKTIALRFGGGFIAMALFFFGPAGTIDYWEAWLLLTIIFIPMLFVVAYFWKNDPMLLWRRMKLGEKEKAQKKIINAYIVLFFVALLLPGIDRRFGWSSVPPLAVVAANAIVLLTYIANALVMKENSYASRIVEVEKRQKVITTGPYKYVRHPMYLAMTVMFFALPIALGSLVALVPFCIIPFVFVPRILNEEKMLKKGLPGYKEYMKKTRYRMIPGLW